MRKLYLLCLTLVGTQLSFGMEDTNHQLIEAARSGSVQGVKELVGRGADVNFQDPRQEGLTALHWATARENRKGL